MTSQAKTSIYIEGNQYWLLDIEKDKVILDGASFAIPKELPLCLSSGNRKGFYVSFFVEKKKLHAVYYGYMKDPKSKHRTCVYSNPVELDFTGSCVVAKSVDDEHPEAIVYNVNSYEEFIYYDYAYELAFVNGELQSARDLSDGYIEGHDWHDWEEEKEYARSFLKKEYGGRMEKESFSVTVDESLKNEMEHRVKKILKLKDDNLVKFMPGIENSIGFAMRYEYHQPLAAHVTGLEIGLKNNKGTMFIRFQKDDDWTVHYESTSEKGYSGPCLEDKVKGFLQSLDVCGILDCTGGEYLKNGHLEWHIHVEFDSGREASASGVDYIPSCWNEYMKVLKELQIP